MNLKAKLSLAFISPLFFFSCARENSDSPNKITLWEMEDAQVAPYIDSTLEAFRKEYKKETGVDLDISRTHYQGEDLRQQFQAASLAGVPPDLLISPSDTAGLYAVSGFIRPVDDLFDFSKFNKPVVEAITLDRKKWGVPISNGNHLMLFYNKKFVKTPPRNTDELFRYCSGEAKKYKFDYCVAFDMGEPFWLMPWLGAFGSWPLDNRKPTLNTPEMRKTLNFYLDLKNKYKYVPPECDYNCMDSLFKEEKVPFIINGDWAISTYLASFKKNFGIALIPKLSETGNWPSPMISGKYFLLSSEVKPKKIEIIKKLINFYTNKENQIRQFNELKRLPALTDASESREIKSDEVSKASMAEILKGRPMPMAVEMRAVWDTVRNYQGLATTGKISVNEAAEKMQANVEKKISEMDR